MKNEEIQIGGRYLTLVSGVLVAVVVVRAETKARLLNHARRTYYTVRREDNGRVLDKARVAAALRPDV